MLLRQTMLYLPAQVIGPLSQVVAAIVWTHWLDPAPYGLLTFLIASQELVFLVCLSWWTHYTMRYYGGFDLSQREHFERSEGAVFAVSFIAQIACTLLVLAFLGQPLTARLAVAAVAYVTTRSLVTNLGERARTQSRIAIYTLGQAAGSLLGFGVAFVAVARISATPEAVLYGFALSQALGALLMAKALDLRIGGLTRSDTIRAATRYGAPLVVAGFLAWMAQNGIRIVVDRLAGAAALGLVAVGWNLGQRLAATLAMLVIAASFPLAVKHLHGGSKAEAFRQIALGGALLTGLVVPASIGLCLLAEPFATRFVAAPFRDTTIAVLPFAAAAGGIRNIRLHIADPIFLLVERPKVNTIISLFDVITLFIGCTVGLLAGGLVGATAGCLAATIVSTLAGFVLARRLAGFSFPYADGARIVLASAVMALGLAAVPWSAARIAPSVRMIAECALGATIYLAVIAALYPAAVGDLRRRIRLRAG